MDKMREEFEEWYASQVSDDNVVQIDLWSAWKASRAALCVELPKAPHFSASDEADLAYEYGVDDMKDRLEAIGISCK